ncbi:diguanylate cyclase (GGDEF) domain-containing protein [Lachnospiraceae bacterium RM5]|nr:diguanylate cyclase (GGDEF) domain-containing protein [Lachnospiraceae bacterium RM5]
MQKYIIDDNTKKLYEHLTVPFAVYQFVDKRVVTLVLSDGFLKLFGYEDREKAYYDMDNDMYKNVHPDDASRIADVAYGFAVNDGVYEVIYRTKVIGKSGYKIIHAFGKHIYTDDGVRLAQVWYLDEGSYEESSFENKIKLNDSLSNALHENSLVQYSKYDYLTGLPNMSYFFELAESSKKAALKKGVKYCMIYMDFTGMKFFNRKYGFEEGDILLQTFAKVLADIFGNENCCRISADHFCVVAELDGVEEKLKKVFLEHQEKNGGKTLHIHVGIYVGRDEAVHESVACDRAKLACEALRGKYETIINYYSQSLSDDADNKQYIIDNFDKALSERWIQVYLQPIVRNVNERVCDVEALARWIDPEKGFLSPASFIPALEDAGLIYKLDLYMVDRVVEMIKIQEDKGFKSVAHSINLSRSDFDACDMVEEIRRRVDDAGISHDRISIEITESVFVRDFEYIKGQIDKFRKLGFPVWMDDFGSGYSSLSVLQSVKFDLIKFDMSFMRKFNEGDNVRVLLSELMRMATSLGFDTVCEGVETKEQVEFLREIGCSKLQGYFFCKPIAFDAILDMFRTKTLIESENPDESEYYENIARLNLYDLKVIASDEEELNHIFNMIPVAVIEITGDKARYLRTNRSYQDFIKEYFDIDILKGETFLEDAESDGKKRIASVIKECCESGNHTFFNEKMPDGSIVHTFIRRVGINPVTGNIAIAIAVLSIE